MPFTHVRILSCRRGSRSFSEVGPSDASCPLRTSLSQTRQLYFSYQILFWKQECAVISACDTWAASAGDVHGVFLFIRKSSEESSVPFPLSGGRAVAQPPVASLGAHGTARRHSSAMGRTWVPGGITGFGVPEPVPTSRHRAMWGNSSRLLWVFLLILVRDLLTDTE